MVIHESELRARLHGDDDEDVYDALVEHFEAEHGGSPFVAAWRLRSGLRIEADRALEAIGDAVRPRLKDRLLDLANDAQRAWRRIRFERRRAENPHWPVIVCEGDSWVAHPYIEDLTDHLLDDDDLPVLALGVGAASDLLGRMEGTRDHERAIEQHRASALLLSGGGNDLMLRFHEFLHPWRTGADPKRLLTPAVDDHMLALVGTIRQMLLRVRRRQPTLPVLVHGYDYLRVGDVGDDGYLARFFDAAGIRSGDERRAVLWAIVDRYNEHLRSTCECVAGVSYVDLRGIVTHDSMWHDDIHPTDDGFALMSTRVGEVLLQRLSDG
ncbi:SGNH/GDSL hydrolase family protein [Paraliomyxa miuraensis]|uniref:SGNH/GDSL hydrolase family protein n=1 Tax=Paraliomyxa miuraensis TaxID=376150 RepID=UPI0022553949|nr:SGNH/GDSL hydrolase family protein [Paraliomyxa miuraensis]MCX4239956.1 SGNH/GDSL hydrolase family protein [Paraliomyxa miuraensis]